MSISEVKKQKAAVLRVEHLAFVCDMFSADEKYSVIELIAIQRARYSVITLGYIPPALMSQLVTLNKKYATLRARKALATPTPVVTEPVVEIVSEPVVEVVKTKKVK